MSLLILIFIFILYKKYNSKININNKTFSNTDHWGKNELTVLNNITTHGKNLLKQMPLIPFPPNTSNITKNEINNIKILNKKRTLSQQKEIKKELSLFGIIDKFSIDKQEYNTLLKFILKSVDPIILNLKKKYNRVRPYRLDTSITPSIKPPKHPSYPSGHSIQSFIIAYLLSEKYPEKKDHFIKTAYSIAKNREYAGVHYSSDTIYGIIIAKKLSELFSKENNPLL